jgi:hypothetical protein
MLVRWRRAIAIYEILTFVATGWDVVRTLAQAPVRVLAIYIVGLLALAGAAVSLVAGLWLWRDERRGRSLSLLVQAAQVPHIILPGLLGFSIALGLSVVIGVGQQPRIVSSAVHLVLAGGPSMKGAYLVLSGGGGAEGRYLGLNVVALAAWTALVRYSPSRAEQGRPSSPSA